MPLSTTEIQLIRAELDSNGIYAPMSDAAVAQELNAENKSQVRKALAGAELLKATDAAEFNSLTGTKPQIWLQLCGVTEVDPSNNGVAREIVVDLFGANSTTVSNLIALRQETVSRARQLDISGRVTAYDVSRARAL